MDCRDFPLRAGRRSSFRSAGGLICLLGTAALLVLGGCSSEQRISLAGDGSGTAEVSVDLHPLMVRYIKDLAAGFSVPAGEQGGGGGKGGEPFRAFDAEQIRGAFARLPGTRIDSLQLPAEGSLRLSASFRRVDELLPPQEGREYEPPLRFTAEGPRRTLRVLVNRRNYAAVYPLLGMEERNALTTFGPQPEPYSEGEYIEMMSYALGDYAGRQEVKAALAGAAADITIEVDGPILSAEGFTAEGRRATAEVSFLRFATLAEPIELSLTWKPE